MMLDRLVVFGAGGHAKVVIDAIERQGRYEVAFLADTDSGRIGSRVLGYTVCGEDDGFAATSMGITSAIIAIGANDARRRIFDAARRVGFTFPTIIHPRAVVAATARIGSGTLIMPGAIVNADASIGDNTIVNSGAVIEHDCVLENGVHVAPHATICGGVHVGAGSLVGAGATVLVGVRIGVGAVIGAGATVLADVPDGVTAVGSPCRILEKKV